MLLGFATSGCCYRRDHGPENSASHTGNNSLRVHKQPFLSYCRASKKTPTSFCWSWCPPLHTWVPTTQSVPQSLIHRSSKTAFLPSLVQQSRLSAPQGLVQWDTAESPVCPSPSKTAYSEPKHQDFVALLKSLGKHAITWEMFFSHPRLWL